MKSRVSKGLLGLMAATLVISMLFMNVVGVDLHELQSIRFSQDYVWHISNVGSASKGAPLDDARLAGHVFYYHYFTDLLLGMCKNVFPMISAFDLVMRCTPFLVNYIFNIGLYAFWRNRAKRPLLMCALFYCAGFAIKALMISGETWISLLNFHVLTNINGMALSLASVMALFLYLFEWRGENNKLYYLNLFVLSAVACGLKGPVAAVFVAAMLGTVAIKVLFYRKTGQKSGLPDVNGDGKTGEMQIVAVGKYSMLLKSVVVLVGFVIVYVLVIEGAENLFKESSNNRVVTFSFSETFMLSPLGKILSPLAGMGLTGMAVYGLIALLIGSIGMIGPMFLVFAKGSLRDGVHVILGRERLADDVLTEVLAGWIGIGGYWFLAQDGLSQGYFIFVAMLFIVRYCLFAAKRLQGRGIARILAAACSVWLALGTGVLLNQVRLAIVDDVASREGWMAAGDRADPGYITIGELEGMEWIRDNTPEDSVLAVDRQSLTRNRVTSENDCRFFYYSAFSERPVYLEGFSYSDADRKLIYERLEVNNRIYRTTGSGFEKAIRETGVDYVVVTKRIADAITGTGSEGMTAAAEGQASLVFSNEDIEIYRVK